MFSLIKTLFGLMLLVAVAAVGYTALYLVAPVAVVKLPVEFEISRGSRMRAVVEQLEQAGIDAGGLQFELLARALGRSRDAKAGSYELTAAVTPLQLLDKLTRGDVLQAEVRFVEGWTFRQMRALLAASPNVRNESANLGSAELLRKIGATYEHPEGLFLPDTYLFSRNASDVSILSRAYRAMQRHLQREWEARRPGLPYKTPYEALIMASIIEKETGKAEERDLIGGVLVNRLRIGMLLQTDPTVIYGLGERFDGNLRRIHLQTDGPYNTYTRPGLPPTPIANPGVASLRAALQPAQTDALYYVARGDGSSEFSRTLQEHNRAVNKYQRAPAQRK